MATDSKHSGRPCLMRPGADHACLEKKGAANASANEKVAGETQPAAVAPAAPARRLAAEVNTPGGGDATATAGVAGSTCAGSVLVVVLHRARASGDGGAIDRKEAARVARRTQRQV